EVFGAGPGLYRDLATFSFHVPIAGSACCAGVSAGSVRARSAPSNPVRPDARRMMVLRFLMVPPCNAHAAEVAHCPAGGHAAQALQGAAAINRLSYPASTSRSYASHTSSGIS